MFPEMKAQEKYWKELDRFSVINNYSPTPESIIKFINTEIDESMRALAFERIRHVLTIRNNKMVNDKQYHNF